MAGLRRQFPVTCPLKLAGLARSTFYCQCKASQVVDKHAQLKARIRATFEQHRGRYGYRRITSVIRRTGRMVDHKTVQSLMQRMQLKCLVRPKRYRAFRGTVGRIAPDVLQRKFTPTRAGTIGCALTSNCSQSAP